MQQWLHKEAKGGKVHFRKREIGNKENEERVDARSLGISFHGRNGYQVNKTKWPQRLQCRSHAGWWTECCRKQHHVAHETAPSTTVSVYCYLFLGRIVQSGPPSRNQLEWKKVKTAIESCTKSYKPEII